MGYGNFCKPSSSTPRLKMSWDFDELDGLEASRASQAFVPSGAAHSRSVLGGGHEPEIERSRRRIEASMHEGWQKILGLNLRKPDSASVRKAYHSLALLHHPDKSGSHADIETFKIVHKAYTDAMATVSLQESTSLLAGVTGTGCSASDHGRKWPLGSSWSKELVRAAVDEWEHDYDDGNVNSVPDCIPEVEAIELASWLQAGKCVAADCREAIEAKYERREPLIPKALRVGFGDLRALPHTLLNDLSQLRRSEYHIVVFSTHGGTSGNCGMCAALLIDVFGFDASRIWRLEEGLDGWIAWAAANPSSQINLL